MTRSSAPLYTRCRRTWTQAALPHRCERRCTGCEQGDGYGVSVRLRPDDLRRVSSPQPMTRLHRLENLMPINHVGKIAYEPAAPPGDIWLQANPPVCNRCWDEIT